ncbi:MAG: XdhC family protein [Betaproteobacteria bacterium]|jgi:xanthine dehydrogenase accessory factor
MENIDVTVLRHLLAWREANKKALLATVVRTWGSSPRPIGSIMAMCEDSTVMGSVSGGCIEDDLIRENTHGKKIIDQAPVFVKYGVTADEAHRFGLPCGGTLELMLEFNPEARALKDLIAGLEQGQLIRRTVNLKDGVVSQDITQKPEELSYSETELTNTFGPEYRMLIIGAGQLSEYMATMAKFNGFQVTVCDPRDEYRANWSVPGVNIVTQSPDDVVVNMKLDKRSCVVALTHDPKLDDLALLEALETQAFYVGAIGSRRNNQSRKQRMIEYFDHTDASLQRLRGPIGIYIGSKTPAEIAVSVMAEVLAVKNGVKLPREMEVSLAKNAQENTTPD